MSSVADNVKPTATNPELSPSKRKSYAIDHSAERKVALITGATSGIGKAFAIELAKQDYNLIITGRRKEVIDEVADNIKGLYGVSVKVIIADLTEKSAVNRLIGLIEKEHNLEILVNNAGYGLNRAFYNDSVMHQLEMLQVHITAPLMLIHKALPLMTNRKTGIIINVSSLAAFIPTRSNIMYTSTKVFMLNFSEALSMEARRHSVRIQCLCPGYTRTHFHAGLGPSALPRTRSLINWLEPAEVVKYSMHCLDKGKVLCIPGRMNRLMVSLIPFVPRKLYYYFANRLQQDPGEGYSEPDHTKKKMTTTA